MATVLVTPSTRASLSLRRLTAVACLFGAEAIHVLVINEHMTESLPAGLFFLLLALLEGVLAVALITTPSRSIERLAISVSLATISVWLVSRTTGIPLGPIPNVESVGRADLVSTTLELVTAAVLLSRTDGTSLTRNSASLYGRAILIFCVVAAVAWFGASNIDSNNEELPDLTPSVPAEAG